MISQSPPICHLPVPPHVARKLAFRTCLINYETRVTFKEQPTQDTHKNQSCQNRMQKQLGLVELSTFLWIVSMAHRLLENKGKRSNSSSLTQKSAKNYQAKCRNKFSSSNCRSNQRAGIRFCHHLQCKIKSNSLPPTKPISFINTASAATLRPLLFTSLFHTCKFGRGVACLVLSSLPFSTTCISIQERF